MNLLPDAGTAFWLLPLLIVAARVLDVSLGTLRVVFVSRGLQWLAPLAGFFEVLIWITAIAQILPHLHHPITYLAYAGGYALGTWIGMRIEERLALGSALVRIVPQRDASTLAGRLRAEGFVVTSIDAEGMKGPVQVLFTVVPRARLETALALVEQFNPRAFYSVEDVRHIGPRARPPGRSPLQRAWLRRPGK